ncbi:unnamed protein product, partial [Rotaria sp. Silwood1]
PLQKRTPSQTDIAEFKDLTKRDALTRLKKSLNKLVLTNQSQSQKNTQVELDEYEQLFNRYLLDNDQSSIDWQDILPPPEDTIISYKKLLEVNIDDAKELLNKLIVVKLNGGLGTTMGCQGPKSVISVRNDLTFLDLTIQQLE